MLFRVVGGFLGDPPNHMHLEMAGNIDRYDYHYTIRGLGDTPTCW